MWDVQGYDQENEDSKGSQNVRFLARLKNGQPHFNVNISVQDNITNQELLLNNGGKFNILSVNLLQEIGEHLRRKITLRQPTVKLISHCGFPMNIIIRKMDFDSELKAISLRVQRTSHSNTQFKFTLSSMKRTTIMLERTEKMNCKASSQPAKTKPNLKKNTVIASLKKDIFPKAIQLVTQESSQHQPTIEITNNDTVPLTSDPGKVKSLKKLQAEIMEKCFCEDNLQEKPCYLFILDPNGLTTVRNVDLCHYKRLPKVDTLFYDGRQLYLVRGKTPTIKDILGIRSNLYSGKKVIFVCPKEELSIKELSQAVSLKTTCGQLGIQLVFRQYQTQQCPRHSTLRWPHTEGLIIRIEFKTKISVKNKSQGKNGKREQSDPILNTFQHENGICRITLIKVPGEPNPIPMCHLFLPNLESVYSRPKLERTLIKLFNEPFRSNPFLTKICIQTPFRYKSTVLSSAMQKAAQSIQRPFQTVDWKMHGFKNFNPMPPNIESLEEKTAH